jgi:hypothetical protein
LPTQVFCLRSMRAVDFQHGLPNFQLSGIVWHPIRFGIRVHRELLLGDRRDYAVHGYLLNCEGVPPASASLPSGVPSPCGSRQPRWLTLRRDIMLRF